MKILVSKQHNEFHSFISQQQHSARVRNIPPEDIEDCNPKSFAKCYQRPHNFLAQCTDTFEYDSIVRCPAAWTRRHSQCTWYHATPLASSDHSADTAIRFRLRTTSASLHPEKWLCSTRSFAWPNSRRRTCHSGSRVEFGIPRVRSTIVVCTFGLSFPNHCSISPARTIRDSVDDIVGGASCER